MTGPKNNMVLNLYQEVAYTSLLADKIGQIFEVFRLQH